MITPVRIGAVLYDPKVAVIWDIIGDFFEKLSCSIEVVYFSNYNLQVEALLNKQIDVAWNSPLAWLEAQRQSGGGCRAIAMRDTDRDRVAHLIVKHSSDIKALADLRGKTVAVGAKDSPQATLIPLGFLERHGLRPGTDFQVKRFDVLVGKHGDHVGGELEALRCLQRGEADACALLDLNWNRWSTDGTANPREYGILATTEKFDHCVFTVREEFPHDVEREWLKVLFSMKYDDPKHREMMDMEGLKQWLPGRTTGFGPLAHAVEMDLFLGR
ncbi:MAG: phosphate/phosphite/phosphonate ABC transporter substrate-binding protein [Dehalococcoidia bacterium]|nr:phosphate/phosphite/phosphonate ABC transporter substrate-binding protein [Dehalococcoidia bacterium]